MHEQGGRPPAGTLGVVSWNIHGWKDGLHAANGRRIHELLARLQPDVVALQEVRHPFQRWFASDFGANGQEDPKANELDLLAERLGMSCVFFNPGMNFGGNAILTRLPILRKFEHTLTAESSGDDRALVGVELQLPGERTITVYCTHLDHRKETARIQQLEQILKFIEEHHTKDTPHLLIGDMNSLNKTDYTDSLWDTLQYYWSTRAWGNLSTQVTDRLKEEGYKDSWFDATPTSSPPPQRVEEKATVQEDDSSEPHSTESEDDDEEDIPDLDLWKIEGKGVPFTHGATRIDYILMSRELGNTATVVERSVPEDDSSDHRPVYVKFQL